MIPARWVGNARPTQNIDLVVIHSAESGEGVGSARNIAKYLARVERKASAHYAVDAEEVLQLVGDGFTAWHAGRGNANSIGIELAGRAGQSEAQWLDGRSRPMLWRAAALVAELARKYPRIKPVYLDGAALLAGRRGGITTHADISRSLGGTDHWDPGPGFPMQYFVSLVAASLGRGGPVLAEDQPPPRGLPTIRRGDRGALVRAAQRASKAAPDGIFGSKTEEAIRELQKAAGISVDGIVGPVTWVAVVSELGQ